VSEIEAWFDHAIASTGDVLGSVDFYLQLVVIVITACVAWFLSRWVRDRLTKISADADEESNSESATVREQVAIFSFLIRDLLFPIFNALLLGVAVAVSSEFFEQKWLVQFVQGMNFIGIACLVATRVSQTTVVRFFALFVMTPVSILYAFSLLDIVIEMLDGIRFELGNINITLYAVTRTVIFGAVLFWLGRLSNSTGQTIIRERVNVDDATRELISKLYQIVIVVVVALLLMQVAGIDISALLVFGGAIGVGLGFGLQQIASNFISGMIILFDRSVTVGDFIELEDGRSGTIRELRMRSATLETYDGKDIMVPNETFITSTFTNWTHNNRKQRYPIVFEVGYDTDFDALFPMLREVVSSHPQVLSGDDVPFEERPDAEIQAFNADGVEILVEFWMEGIDDGKNRVGGDLLHMIIKALQEHDIEIPYPQRVVTFKNSDGETIEATASNARRPTARKDKPDSS